jgi:hypothetical protein
MMTLTDSQPFEVAATVKSAFTPVLETAICCPVGYGPPIWKDTMGTVIEPVAAPWKPTRICAL